VISGKKKDLKSPLNEEVRRENLEREKLGSTG